MDNHYKTLQGKEKLVYYWQHFDERRRNIADCKKILFCQHSKQDLFNSKKKMYTASLLDFSEIGHLLHVVFNDLCTIMKPPNVFLLYNFRIIVYVLVVISSGGSKGGARDAPRGPNSFIFMQ